MNITTVSVVPGYDSTIELLGFLFDGFKNGRQGVRVHRMEEAQGYKLQILRDGFEPKEIEVRVSTECTGDLHIVPDGSIESPQINLPVPGNPDEDDDVVRIPESCSRAEMYRFRNFLFDTFLLGEPLEI